MAKIRHNNIIDTVDEVFSLAKNNGIIHLYADDYQLDGRYLSFDKRKALHFGTCGYLGLEHHPAIKDMAIEAIQRYGTQFPMSKTYVSNPLYSELEHLIENMYNAPVVISKNCTLSHQAVIPTIIRQSDLIILDHQVHTSVQEAVKKLLSQGVDVEMIRHSNLEMLEDRVKKTRSKYKKIWYMADGIYSMYGDLAPIKELIALADKYDQLHLYIDDAHGMSWAGKHGTGYVMSQMDGLYEKMILTTTMGKGFGSCGGLTLFPNKEWQRKVKIFGGPLTFSVQMEPPVLGASLASAKIHLSEEITVYQDELQQKIAYCNELIDATDLPLIRENISPIFYIGTGTLGVGNKLIAKLLEDGVYVSLAPFPSVPAKNTGVRITVSRNNTKEDIEEMVNKLDFHMSNTLRENNLTKSKIWEAFKMSPKKRVKEDELKKIDDPKIILAVHDSITKIHKNVWNEHLGHRGMFDWEGMRFLEKSFSGNVEKESNWKFRYYEVKDANGKVVLMTVFVIALYKEDMFSRVSISKVLEEERLINPYHLTSNALVMGSLFTEGNHMYIDRMSLVWKQSLLKLIDSVYGEQKSHDASSIIFRDFEAEDDEMHGFMMEQGFVKVEMPESCVIENFDWEDEIAFKNTLTKKNKKHFNRYVKKYEKFFNVEIRNELNEEELQHAIKLFRNVRDNNLAINSFDFPEKLFQEMNNNPIWEFVLLYMKGEYSDERKPVGICFCHKNPSQVYSFMLIGMDYDYVHEYGVYRQALHHIAKRAKELGSKRANFGISAVIEKKRVGAMPHAKVAYVQAKDNYVMEMLESTVALEKD